jgi:amidohydrolase
MATVVVTIGTIEGGYRNNIIADRVFMTGTFRSQDPAVRAGLEPRARRILEGVAAAYGTRAKLEVIYGYPPVVNDAGIAASFRTYLAREKPDLPVQSPAATMGGEDFAYFAERAPGVLVRLGIYNEAAGSVHPGHSPLFRVDEDAIPVGIETLVAFARGVGRREVTAQNPRP